MVLGLGENEMVDEFLQGNDMYIYGERFFNGYRYIELDEVDGTVFITWLKANNIPFLTKEMLY